MRTRLRASNPFGYSRCGFAWEHVPEGVATHLDLGCSDGHFLSSLEPKGIRRLVGLDVSWPAIDAARRKHPNLEFVYVHAGQCLPFADGECDSVSMLDVLEHISDQAGTLAEIHRILKDSGLIIVTVPRKHLFSFLDTGNLKFLFPRLHKWYYCLRHSREEYNRRYVSNPDGLVGDVNDKKRWHEHFSPLVLTMLLERAGFQPLKFDGAGFFCRPIIVLDLCMKWIGWRRRPLAAFSDWDAKAFESTNLFCQARKKVPSA